MCIIVMAVAVQTIDGHLDSVMGLPVQLTVTLLDEVMQQLPLSPSASAPSTSPTASPQLIRSSA